MKSSSKNFNISMLLSGALILLIVSCKKTTVNEIMINDFPSLSAEFGSPPPEYTTSPFLVWNYKITKEEINNFLQDFKKQGSLQVFIHPRPGLITEYLSGEWLELFRYTVEKGRELGMKIWIYDENSYPSGFGGGHVPDRMPESFNKGQGLAMIQAEILPDTAASYFLCLKEDGKRFRDITSSLAEHRGKPGKYFLFTKTYYGRSDWYGGFTYVDLLAPGVTQKFIEITMDGYEKTSGDEFGKTVPGVFTDEPEIVSPGGVRWTPDLFDVFRKEWGYDLKEHLPSLFEEAGDFKKIRHNYTRTLLRMFIDRWAKPYYYYCESKDLIFTGHYWEHAWPAMAHGGDNMAMYAWHQMPGIDMLFNQWNDSTPRGQFGNVRSVKELAGAANQTGRQRKLSETYGGAGWDVTFTDLKRLGDWEYALGVNFMNQHLSHINLAGARKYDYPPSFTYHEPWWESYKYLNDHYARLSLALSSGRQINDILVLEPTTTAWLYDSYVSSNPKLAEIGQSFQTFITTLEKNQVEYDLGSENIIKDIGSVKNGRFIVGRCVYSTVVIPPMTENLDYETFTLLEKFVAQGGKLVAFSLPSLVNGSSSEALNGFLTKYSGQIIIEKSLTPETMNKYFAGRQISFTGFEGGSLYHHRRILSDGHLLFMANASLTEYTEGSAGIAGADVIEMNSMTGEIIGYPHEPERENVSFSVSIPPAGSLLLFIPSHEHGNYAIPSAPENFTKLPCSSPLSVSRDAENAIAIEFCDLIIGEEMSKDLNTYDAADKVYKHYGFVNGNPWNHSVQFKTNITDRDTFRTGTGFTANYHFSVKGGFDFSTFRAVVERPELWKVSVNGMQINPEDGKWWLDREFRVFDISKQVKPGENTITLICSPMKVLAEIEPVYITGNFSVTPAIRGWILEPPVKELTTGSWKEQGIPFYSWGVTYSKEYDFGDAEGQYLVRLDKWSGTVAEISVNKEPAGIIGFPPFELDITRLAGKGSNTIEVKVIGSLKNLLGPHFNNPAPGLASPWSWRNVESYPPGEDYQLIDYGLFDEFEVLVAN